MSKGPSRPKTDYGNLWKNYSSWLQEAKSTFSSASHSSKAKRGASGITGATVSIVDKMRESAHTSELTGIRGGYTGKELKKYGEAQYAREKIQYETDEGATRYKFGDVVKGEPWEMLGITEASYAKYSKLFKEKTGADAEPWEVYFVQKYGFAENESGTEGLGTEDKMAARRIMGATLNSPTTTSPWI